jgi:hypothetical protein
MDDLAIDLLNTEPTTVAGIEALLRHFADQDEGLFPDNVCNDDGRQRHSGAISSVTPPMHSAKSRGRTAG